MEVVIKPSSHDLSFPMRQNAGAVPWVNTKWENSTAVNMENHSGFMGWIIVIPMHTKELWSFMGMIACRMKKFTQEFFVTALVVWWFHINFLTCLHISSKNRKNRLYFGSMNKSNNTGQSWRFFYLQKPTGTRKNFQSPHIAIFELWIGAYVSLFYSSPWYKVSILSKNILENSGKYILPQHFSVVLFQLIWKPALLLLILVYSLFLC